MGYLHHSRYFQYFEMGRVELLRSLGHSYADLERDGVFFVVAKAECRFKAPARYDDARARDAVGAESIDGVRKAKRVVIAHERLCVPQRFPGWRHARGGRCPDSRITPEC